MKKRLISAESKQKCASLMARTCPSLHCSVLHGYLALAVEVPVLMTTTTMKKKTLLTYDTIGKPEKKRHARSII